MMLFVSITISGLSAVQAERRVALVIGNSAYTSTASLANPTNDAKALSEALERLGFEVLTGLDTDIHQMIGLVRDFSKALDGADVALFYYAGHGLQVDGNNYLAPIDADLDDRADLDFGTVKLSSILRQMNRHRTANLVFLDACRNNPLAKTLGRSMVSSGRSVNIGRGLARIEAGIGTLISYATQPGNIALDGSDGHSPFTKALLAHIETPGLDVGSLMIKVRQDVIRATEEKQVPWDHSSLTGQFYFKPGKSNDTQQVAAVNPAQTVDSTTRSANESRTRAAATRLEAEQSAMELSFWNTVKDSNDPDLLRTYVERFPEGVYADLARVLMARAIRRAQTEVASVDLTTPKVEEPEAAAEPATEPGSANAEENEQEAVKEDATDDTPAEASAPEENEAPDALAKLRQKALDGDRGAAIELAGHYDGEGQPERGAEFALMAIKDGGDESVAPFLSNTKTWSKDFWSAVQARLKKEKLYRGIIDGLPGGGTKSAVQAYAGIKTPIAPTAAVKPRKPVANPSYKAPQKRKPAPPPQGKPPPNKWCLVDPNSSRCTSQ